MADTLHIQGLCRFSYLGEQGNFQSTPDDDAARAAYLFAPERLEQRCVWFEQVALPSIRGQSDPDFTMHLMLAEDLPAPFRGRILNAISDVPQIRPVFHPIAQPRLAYRDILIPARDPNANTVAEFRLDDDDAMGHGFVAQIRRRHGLAQRLFAPKQQRAALDFGMGVVLDVDDAGNVAVIPVHSRTWPCALAVYLRPDDPGCVMDFPHHRITHLMPVLSYPRPLMYARGRHATNDSAVGIAPARQMSTAEAEDRLMPDFGIDISQLRAEMAKLAN